MRLHVGILLVAITASAAWAQLPILENTRNKLKTATEKNLPENAQKNVNPPAKPGGAPVHAATPPAQGKGAVTPPKAPVKPVTAKKPAKKAVLAASAPAPKPETKPETAAKGETTPAPADEAGKKEDNNGADLPASMGEVSKKFAVARRDPFVSPVNSMNKAYFLRENDPIFNGYVLRITGDSIVFKENFQDNLGKPRTREIVKKISTPAV